MQSKIALLSIHPEYAKDIIGGRKLYEFRRIHFASPVSHVVIYATLPEKAVIGWFEVEAIHQGTPEELWSRFYADAGIKRGKYNEYYKGCKEGIAIEARQAIAVKPLKLAELGIKTAPQSFIYLSAEQFSRVRSNA